MQKVVILKRNDESVLDKREIQDFQARNQILSQKDKSLSSRSTSENIKKEDNKKKEPDNPTGERKSIFSMINSKKIKIFKQLKSNLLLICSHR